MRFAIIYLSTLVIMLPLDFAFLGAFGKNLFSANVGDMVLETPRLPPAILFYALNLAGVVISVNGTTPSDWTHNLLYGALCGLFGHCLWCALRTVTGSGKSDVQVRS
jgi:uncharacterized membrane protein